ncbi:hypothetical protein FS837_003251 [Tulasnella sp. UAMH 9824]|nr:hypothetical protein FS837_003251 [Tulasnella sp. UAMH 9824]
MGKRRGGAARGGKARGGRRPPVQTQTEPGEEGDRGSSPPSHSQQSNITEDLAPTSPLPHVGSHEHYGQDEDEMPDSDGHDQQSDAEDQQELRRRSLRNRPNPVQPAAATSNSQSTRPEPRDIQSSGARRTANSVQRAAPAIPTQARSRSRLESLRGPSPSPFALVPEQPYSLVQPLPANLYSQLNAAAPVGSPTTPAISSIIPSMTPSASQQVSCAPRSTVRSREPSMAPVSRTDSTALNSRSASNAPIPRSASVGPPESHKRSPEDDIASEASKEEQKRVKKKKYNDARARLSHFSDNALLRDVLFLAMTFMKIEVSAVCPYPAADLRTRIVDECFARALQDRELPHGHFTLDKAQQRMILAEEGSMRSLIKKAIKPRVAIHYGLIAGPSPQQAITNKERAQFLLSESRFHFQNPDEKEGWFRHPFIADAIIASWFSHSNALGALYQGYFNPIRLESLALILAITHHCLSQWVESGTCKEFDLPQGLWSTYDDFFMALKNYEKWSPVSAIKLTQYRTRLFKRGLAHSGAKEEAPVRMPVIEIDDEAMEAEMRWQASQEDEEDIV